VDNTAIYFYGEGGSILAEAQIAFCPTGCTTNHLHKIVHRTQAVFRCHEISDRLAQVSIGGIVAKHRHCHRRDHLHPSLQIGHRYDIG